MLSDQLNHYLTKHSKPLSSHLSQIQKKTQQLPSSHMLSGSLMSTFLGFLVKMTKAKLAIDVGTYVGFSALSLAEAMGNEGEVRTYENNSEHAAIAKSNIQNHPQGDKVKLFLGDALDLLKEIDQPVDLAFIDANKRPYAQYYEILVEKLRPGGVMVIDDALWKGEVISPTETKHETMNQLNELIHQDPRVENLLIPIRHGINLVYKL